MNRFKSLIMSYIQTKDETLQVNKLTCSHPLVNKIWQHGGMAEIPTNSLAVRFVCLWLADGSTHQFKDNGDGKAIEDAEIFLNSLPHEV